MSKLHKLNPSQKKFYRDNGYLLVENFIKESKAQKIKKYALNKLAEKPNYPINLNVHRRDKTFFKIISDKNLVKIVNELQKSKVVGMNDQMIYKKRKSAYAGQSWTIHQDNAYIRAPKNSYIIAHLFWMIVHQKMVVLFWRVLIKRNIRFKVRKSHKKK